MFFWGLAGVVLFATLALVGFHLLVALIVAAIATAVGSQLKRAGQEFRRGLRS